MKSGGENPPGEVWTDQNSIVAALTCPVEFHRKAMTTTYFHFNEQVCPHLDGPAE